MSADDVIGFYERHAKTWAGDRSRMRLLFEKAWLDRFAAPIPAGATILDLGCGFGKPMAAYLIGRGFDICGVDSSSSMIGMAKANFPEREWIVADMRTLDLGRRFAGIMAWDSFFHLNHEDQQRMFPVFAAHAAANAPLLFTSGPRHGEAIGQLFGEPLYHASLAPDEYRALLAAHGFAVVDARMEDPDCDRHSVWLARRNEDR